MIHPFAEKTVLVGNMWKNGVIENCYSHSNVTVYSGIGGGFCGSFTSLLEVNSSYSTGTATGTEFIGGFLGTALSVVLENNYWDKESSAHIDGVCEWQGQTPGTENLYGKTTAEMKTNSMVADLNQGGTVWTLYAAENDGYPSFVLGETTSVLKGPNMQIQCKVFPTAFETDFKVESEDLSFILDIIRQLNAHSNPFHHPVFLML